MDPKARALLKEVHAKYNYLSEQCACDPPCLMCRIRDYLKENPAPERICADEKCKAKFCPTHHGQLYCSFKCKNRVAQRRAYSKRMQGYSGSIGARKAR